ncbi:OPT oligopeptide transporter protein-domain-containing protein [Zopfochytrium polystomum]|nr:OPT oligopeptide transporter protein-domain-containing protein [Zopfochytrium polystomum]
MKTAQEVSKHQYYYDKDGYWVQQEVDLTEEWNRQNGSIGLEEGYGENEDNGDFFLDDIYDIVDSIVPRDDDVAMPALTFRVWIIGIFFATLLASVNTMFTFRTNYFSINPFIVLLVSYPIGHLLARILPTRQLPIPFTSTTFTFNPGPFTYKEHALIYIFCGNASRPAYSLYNIVTQRYLLGQPVSLFMCVLFGIVSQCWGYGLAGACRKFLVRPAAMLWPSTLSVVALLRSIHEGATAGDGVMDRAAAADLDGVAAAPTGSTTDSKRAMVQGSGIKWWSRAKFFWVAMGLMMVYQLVPSFVAPAVGAISILCYIAPNSQRVKMLGSAREGVGMLSLTLDWSIMSQMQPIVSPLWALWNQYVGIWLILWVVVPLLWVNNAFGIDQTLGTAPSQGPNGSGRFPLGQALNSNLLFDKNGKQISSVSLSRQVNNTVVLNEPVYEASKPIYMTTYMAIDYMMYFVAYTATIVHVIVWYGQDLWYRFKSSMRDLDSTDVHAMLMDQYLDVPNSWYFFLIFGTTLVALTIGSFGGFDLPWWAVLLSLFLTVISILPIGTIEAISGQRIGLNVISELIMGFILPGRIVTVMSFKTLTHMGMYQGLAFVEDMKFGHYMKIPPRALFVVQLFSTVYCLVVNVLVAVAVYEGIGVTVMNVNPPAGWNANGYRTFLSAGTIWGAIGTSSFFGPSSPYFKTLAGFLVGLVGPLVPWALHRVFPTASFNLVNVPLLAVLPTAAGSTRSDLVSPFLVGVAVNYFAKRHSHEWWRRYAYVMSAAFDTGAATAISVLLLVVAANANYVITMPYWYLNRYDQESCAPAFYLTCMERLVWGHSYGRNNYTFASDPECALMGSILG